MKHKPEQAHGDEDMMQEPHPIQRIENYDPNGPLPPIFEPGGGGLEPGLSWQQVTERFGRPDDKDYVPVDIPIDPNLQYPNRHSTARRPNMFLDTTCPHCGKNISIDLEPNRR